MIYFAYAEEFCLLSVLADLEPGYFKPVWNAPGFPAALLAALCGVGDSVGSDRESSLDGPAS